MQQDHAGKARKMASKIAGKIAPVQNLSLVEIELTKAQADALTYARDFTLWRAAGKWVARGRRFSAETIVALKRLGLVTQHRASGCIMATGAGRTWLDMQGAR